MDELFPGHPMPDHDRPIPERIICDTPEALSEAVAAMKDWDDVAVVERDGKRVAAIISANDLELFMRLLWDKEMEQDFAAIESHEREDGESIPTEELMDELGIPRSASSIVFELSGEPNGRFDGYPARFSGECWSQPMRSGTIRDLTDTTS